MKSSKRLINIARIRVIVYCLAASYESEYYRENLL